MPLRASARYASDMNSGLAVSQEMNRKPVPMNCNGVFGVAAAISRIRSQGHSRLNRTATPMCVEVVKSMALKPTRSMTGAMLSVRAVSMPTRAPQALIAVAQRGFDQLDFSHDPAAAYLPALEQPRQIARVHAAMHELRIRQHSACNSRLVATPSMRVTATAARSRASAWARSRPYAMILPSSES